MTEASNPTVRDRFVALDAWRGLAALFVAYGHFKTNGSLSTLSIASTTGRFVDLFFVLSGFVIAHSYSARASGNPSFIAGFARARFFRLWPLHLFIMLGFVCYQFAVLGANTLGIVKEPKAFSDGYLLSWLPANLLLVQAWGFAPNPTWNDPAWSISTEVAAYIVFALFFVLARQAGYLLFLAAFLACGVGIVISPQIMTDTYALALVRCMYGFSAGVCVYWVWQRFRVVSLALSTAVELVLTVVIFAAVAFLPPELAWLDVLIFSVAVLIFAMERGAVSWILRGRVFVSLGEASYSIYLTHTLLLVGAFSVAAVLGFVGQNAMGKTAILAHGILGDALIVVFLLCVVGISRLTYRYIERPGIELGRRRARS